MQSNLAAKLLKNKQNAKENVYFFYILSVN